jgi:Protein of unknown function (DUF3307)
MLLITYSHTLFLLMLALFTKHLLADFAWQTPKMVAEKGTYGASGGLHHSSIHGALTVFVLCFFLPFGGALAYGLIDGIVHYHIDWAKININKKYKYTVEDAKFWWWLGVDQFLHQLTYLVMVVFILT